MSKPRSHPIFLFAILLLSSAALGEPADIDQSTESPSRKLGENVPAGSRPAGPSDDQSMPTYPDAAVSPGNMAGDGQPLATTGEIASLSLKELRELGWEVGMPLSDAKCPGRELSDETNQVPYWAHCDKKCIVKGVRACAYLGTDNLIERVKFGLFGNCATDTKPAITRFVLPYELRGSRILPNSAATRELVDAELTCVLASTLKSNPQADPRLTDSLRDAAMDREVGFWQVSLTSRHTEYLSLLEFTRSPLRIKYKAKERVLVEGFLHTPSNVGERNSCGSEYPGSLAKVQMTILRERSGKLIKQFDGFYCTYPRSQSVQVDGDWGYEEKAKVESARIRKAEEQLPPTRRTPEEILERREEKETAAAESRLIEIAKANALCPDGMLPEPIEFDSQRRLISYGCNTPLLPTICPRGQYEALYSGDESLTQSHRYHSGGGFSGTDASKAHPKRKDLSARPEAFVRTERNNIDVNCRLEKPLCLHPAVLMKSQDGSQGSCLFCPSGTRFDAKESFTAASRRRGRETLCSGSEKLLNSVTPTIVEH